MELLPAGRELGGTGRRAAAEEVAQPGEVTASRQETATAPIAEEPRAASQTSEAVPPPQQEPNLPQQAAITPPQGPATPQQEPAAPQQQAAAPQPETAIQQEPAAPQQQAAAPQPEPAAPQQEAAAPQQETSAAVSEEPQHTTKRRSITPVRHAAPAAWPIVEKRRAAKANVDTQPRASAGKTAAREDRSAKGGKEAANKPANEALNAVRRFQDNLRDIPVSSYAADGTRRTIVIRPTSIQDVYYYSAPR